MPELTSFFRVSSWIVAVSLTLSIILIWLMVTGGKKYMSEDAEAHAQEYAGLVKEGHGGMTGFLWMSFAMVLIWTVVYLMLHWREFAVVFTQGQ